MKKYFFYTFAVITTSLLLFNCTDTPSLTAKSSESDPFKETIVSSQYFKVNINDDSVIEGNKGTLIVLSKENFIDGNGNIIKGNIDIELAEALTYDDMLLSNLTTTSGNTLLETGGMLYFNATKDGKQLFVNPDNPVHIEIPTSKRKSGMMVYKGIRDLYGNMDWISPRELNNYLIPIDIDALDFLPRGFVEAVEKGMPFKKHTKTTPQLIDSLYYSLALGIEPEIIEESTPNLDINETYYDNKNTNKPDLQINTETDVTIDLFPQNDSVYYTYGVDPAIIKTIKTGQFQNTIISTREFEKRLQLMFKICRTDIIDIYINNLDKNLWELDSIAAVVLDYSKYQKHFESFAKERLTNIKGFDKNSQLLKEYYEKQLKSVKKELNDLRRKAIIAQNKETEKARKIVFEYTNLLNKREKYRMETYGFEMTFLMVGFSILIKMPL